MSLTFSPYNIAQPQARGALKEYYGSLTFDSSYAGSAGEAIAQAGCRFDVNKIFGIDIHGTNAAAAPNIFNWDYVNKTMKAFGGPGGGIRTYAPGGGDLKGATNPAGTEGNADQAAAPVNSALFLAADTFTNFAGTMTPTVQPDVPRNVMITIFNDTGGSLNLYEGVTTFLITGTAFDGSAQTESVTLTSTAGNKAVANTPKYRYVQGVKAFRTITNVTITNAPAGTLKGSLGPGTRIGLPSNLLTPAYTDVVGITVSAARIAPTDTDANAGGVDQTNMTINTGTTADGNDVSVSYREAAQAIIAGTDLSTYVLRVSILVPDGLIT